MYSTSVYKYLRPFFFLCCIIGQFSSVKVLSQASEDLEFKLLSIPVLMFVFGQILGLYTLKNVIFERLKNHSFLMVHHTLTIGLNIIVMVWLTACSKDIIKSLKETDKARRNISLLPQNCRPKESSMFVPAFLAVLLLVIAMIAGLVQAFLVVPSGYVMEGFIHFVFLNLFPFKSLLVVGAVFFSASLPVQDIVESLRLYKKYNCKPDQNIHIFCQLVMLQSEFMRSISKTMTSYLVTALGCRVFNILNVRFYRVHLAKRHIVSSAVDFTAWNACMMYFLLGVNSSAVQVRLLLAQLQAGPADVTAAGFAKVKPHLFLSFFGMAVEWMIIFMQNIDIFRELVGLENFSEALNNAKVEPQNSAVEK